MAYSVFIAIVAAFLSAYAGYRRWQHRSRRRKPVAVGGFVMSGFEKVLEAFKKNLENGLEPAGAAFSVYHKNELVVDLYGGYADAASGTLWQKDTLAVIFSCTKAVSSLCIALLVDRGHLAYDRLLVDLPWPEFGKHGKNTITVNDVLNHRAGLAYFDAPITEKAAKDHRLMSKLIENEAPKWSPGTCTAYHPVTFGWIVDQIVRRADPQRRSLGQFFREEIQAKFGLDVHIGLPRKDAPRVATISQPSFPRRVLSSVFRPDDLKDVLRFLIDLATNGPVAKTELNPSWLRFDMKLTLNNPEYYALEQGALMGIATARDLARLFDLTFLQNKLFSPESKILNRLKKPMSVESDVLQGVTIPRGHGFTFTPRRHHSSTLQLIGHSGYGGQNVRYDADTELAFAYVSNGLKGPYGDLVPTYRNLVDAIYNCVG